MRRSARVLSTRKVEILDQDENLTRDILALHGRDKHRAALAAVEGVMRERLSTDREDTIQWVEDAIVMMKKYIAIRDIKAHPENGDGITIDDIMDDESVIQLNPFSRGWELIRYDKVQLSKEDDCQDGDEQ